MLKQVGLKVHGMLDSAGLQCAPCNQWAGGPSGSNRVKRGGSFDNNDDNLRVSNRNDDNPSDDNDNLGCRCASSRHRQTGRLHGRGLRAGRDHRLPSRAGESQTKRSARAGSDYLPAPFRASFLHRHPRPAVVQLGSGEQDMCILGLDP